MSAEPLHIDLPDEVAPSFIPWVIIIVCSVVLVLLATRLTQSIPASLQAQARQLVSGSELPDVSVQAVGRDLVLSGNISTDESAASLVRSLAEIDGVSTVSDQLTIVDPVADAQISIDQFNRELAAIDVSSVAFTPGSVAFTGQSDAALAQLLTLLQQFPQGRIRIEGHTDNTGPDNVNLRVSRDRAAAVANYLMARGIPSDQLLATGYGSTQPIADNSSEAGRARNRRIEIYAVN